MYGTRQCNEFWTSKHRHDNCRLVWSGYDGRQLERVDATVATTLPILGSAT
jgi:hypothetical protein